MCNQISSSQVPTSNSNLPPRTVPYRQYKFPNWHQNKGEFEQNCDGFGFSNFRLSCDNPNTINESLSPGCRVNPETQPDNPLTTQEVQRSETFLFRDKYGDYGLYADYREDTTNDNHNYESIEWN